MRYQVTTLDYCTPGFERLRSHDEFILNAYPAQGETGDDIRDELIDDLDSCMRPDGFDYEAAADAVRAHFDTDTSASLTADIASVTAEMEEDDDGEGWPMIFCYIRDTQAEDEA